jgi:hypothetical protein
MRGHVGAIPAEYGAMVPQWRIVSDKFHIH